MIGMEGMGEVVTGGMLARAVEPEAGEAGHQHGTACLNCGTGLIGAYCHRCGQQSHVHRTLVAFWHDLAHGVLHFEGKIWRTLPLLAWRPGELTRRYIEGERARFVSPMALFLFSVFLMFAIFSSVGGPFHFNSGKGDRADARAEFTEARAETLTELDTLRNERAKLAATGKSTASVDADISEAERKLTLQETLFKEALALAGEQEKDAAEAKTETSSDAIGMDLDDAPGDLATFKEAYKKAKKNPSLLLYKLQSNAYKYSWVLIPISVPFVWLLFLHRRRYRQYRAYDHTVFVTYSIAFMSLGVIVLSLARPLGLSGGAAALAIMIIPPLHMYRQLRGAYRLSRWSALWRTAMLLFFATIAAALFSLLLVTLGVLG